MVGAPLPGRPRPSPRRSLEPCRPGRGPLCGPVSLFASAVPPCRLSGPGPLRAGGGALGPSVRRNLLCIVQWLSNVKERMGTRRVRGAGDLRRRLAASPLLPSREGVVWQDARLSCGNGRLVYALRRGNARGKIQKNAFSLQSSRGQRRVTQKNGTAAAESPRFPRPRASPRAATPPAYRPYVPPHTAPQSAPASRPAYRPEYRPAAKTSRPSVGDAPKSRFIFP